MGNDPVTGWIDHLTGEAGINPSEPMGERPSMWAGWYGAGLPEPAPVLERSITSGMSVSCSPWLVPPPLWLVSREFPTAGPRRGIRDASLIAVPAGIAAVVLSSVFGA